MRGYISYFKLRMINGMQYRTAALAGIATQFFWGFMYIMIYEAFYTNVASSQPISLSNLITYLWLQQAFLVIIMLWFRDNELLDLITSGNIAYELCRPCSMYDFWYIKLTAQRLSGALLRCFPILIISFFLPQPYRMELPPDIETLILFLITLILGLAIVVALSMLIYISVFKTMSPIGTLLIFSIIGDFFAGGIIPVPLMPLWLQKIVYLLPFRLTQDLPFRVYSGNIPSNEALIGIAVQILWLSVLILLGKLAMRKVLRNVVVQGG